MQCAGDSLQGHHPGRVRRHDPQQRDRQTAPDVQAHGQSAGRRRLGVLLTDMSKSLLIVLFLCADQLNKRPRF